MDGGTSDVPLSGTGVSHIIEPVVRFRAPNAPFEIVVPFWSRKGTRNELAAV